MIGRHVRTTSASVSYLNSGDLHGDDRKTCPYHYFSFRLFAVVRRPFFVAPDGILDPVADLDVGYTVRV